MSHTILMTSICTVSLSIFCLKFELRAIFVETNEHTYNIKPPIQKLKEKKIEAQNYYYSRAREEKSQEKITKKRKKEKIMKIEEKRKN